MLRATRWPSRAEETAPRVVRLPPSWWTGEPPLPNVHLGASRATCVVMSELTVTDARARLAEVVDSARVGHLGSTHGIRLPALDGGATVGLDVGTALTMLLSWVGGLFAAIGLVVLVALIGDSVRDRARARARAGNSENSAGGSSWRRV